MIEVVAILEGLCLAVDMEIQRVKVEIDSQGLISHLSLLDVPISFIGLIISYIKLLASSFVSIYFSYVPRASNIVAYRLVQFGLLLDLPSRWIENAPILIVDSLMKLTSSSQKNE